MGKKIRRNRGANPSRTNRIHPSHFLLVLGGAPPILILFTINGRQNLLDCILEDRLSRDGCGDCPDFNNQRIDEPNFSPTPHTLSQLETGEDG
ncbi:hypothetical protein BGS_0996 [Beggiatoa sp. SS]|nr:hypothetical protein BGS_0996 [Beggiatoa sp. SS]